MILIDIYIILIKSFTANSINFIAINNHIF